MADNSAAKTGWFSLHEIVLDRRVLLRIVGAIASIALVWGTWSAHKQVHFPSLRKWTTSALDPSVSLGLGAGCLLTLAILWKVPQLQVGSVKGIEPKERFDRVNEARKTLAQILGGILLLAGFFGTWQNIKVAQESAATSQKALEMEQVQDAHRLYLGGEH